MSEKNLQQLTEKLYNEGIEKARAEEEKIITDAKKKAEEIIKNARNEEKKIIKEAEEYAENLRKNVQSEVKLSGRQAISAVKHQITHLIKAKILDKPLKEAFDDVEFLKGIIETAIRNWSPRVSEPVELTLLLPRSKEKEMAKHFLDKGANTLNEGIEINFTDDIKSGFKLGPKDGSYRVSFTDEDFDRFFTDYLRPRMVRLLYGVEENSES
jgi:V/A-type H+/Na+-transporting ATPase subunit E